MSNLSEILISTDSNLSKETSRKSEKDKQEQNNKYESRHQMKGKLRNKLMPYLTCFLILFGKVTLGEENEEYFKTNKIQKGNIKSLHRNTSFEQRINRRQIDDESSRPINVMKKKMYLLQSFCLLILLNAIETMEVHIIHRQRRKHKYCRRFVEYL